MRRATSGPGRRGGWAAAAALAVLALVALLAVHGGPAVADSVMEPRHHAFAMDIPGSPAAPESGACEGCTVPACAGAFLPAAAPSGGQRLSPARRGARPLDHPRLKGRVVAPRGRPPRRHRA